MVGPAGGAAATLSTRLALLRRTYGKPAPPEVTDPLGQILWENVAYLADDARRSEAFAALRDTVGLAPAKILAAPRGALERVGRRGILAAGSAEKLRDIARIAESRFGGDLSSILALPLAEARKALRAFPAIGEPAADRILLFARRPGVFSTDSNVLRVLLRLGYGHEGPSYAASYRSALEAVAPELPASAEKRIEAYQLLRRHGQELCKRSHPLCDACPLRTGCVYGSGRAPDGGGAKPDARPRASGKRAPRSRDPRRRGR